MKALIAEDDTVSSTLLKTLLSVYGECDVAEDGDKAVKKFKSAAEDNDPYDLVCLDIMMPIKDGQEALQNIRELEQESGIRGSAEVKVLMVTALDDVKTIIGSLKEGATAYIVKPVNRDVLEEHLRSFGLM